MKFDSDDDKEITMLKEDLKLEPTPPITIKPKVSINSMTKNDKIHSNKDIKSISPVSSRPEVIIRYVSKLIFSSSESDEETSNIKSNKISNKIPCKPIIKEEILQQKKQNKLIPSNASKMIFSDDSDEVKISGNATPIKTNLEKISNRFNFSDSDDEDKNIIKSKNDSLRDTTKMKQLPIVNKVTQQIKTIPTSCNQSRVLDTTTLNRFGISSSSEDN
jgi:hypothetical protein